MEVQVFGKLQSDARSYCILCRFHAICFICADSLVSRKKTDLARTIYRSLDHGPVKRQLLSSAAEVISPDISRVGDLFAVLQQQRHAADYEPTAPLFNVSQALAVMAAAKLAISLLEQLDTDARMRLAVLLVVHKRPA